MKSVLSIFILPFLLVGQSWSKNEVNPIELCSNMHQICEEFESKIVATIVFSSEPFNPSEELIRFEFGYENSIKISLVSTISEAIFVTEDIHQNYLGAAEQYPEWIQLNPFDDNMPIFEVYLGGINLNGVFFITDIVKYDWY